MGKIRKGPGTRASGYVDEILATVEALRSDGTGLGDLKIAHAALEEMRRAFRVFAEYKDVRKVSVFGSARTPADDPAFAVAERFGHCIADAGFMVITGAGPGVMEACQRGAGRARSFGVNIQLPFEQQANRFIRGDPKLLNFKYFFTRKLFFIKEADAVVLLPGGFGTHDEGLETLTLLQTGKCQMLPVVFLDVPGGTYWKTWHRYVQEHLLRRAMISREDLALYRVTDDVEDAVAEIVSFYRVYHSARWVRDRLVLRLERRLPPAFVDALAVEFADILVEPGITQQEAFPVERDQPELLRLPRLVLRFDKHHHGRLRRLIDRINTAPPE